MPLFLWFVLGFGWILLLINLGLMKHDQPQTVYILNAFVTFSIMVIVCLMICYNLPFSGSVKANTKPFHVILDNINNYKAV
ncbi:MAG: hypothetical protein EBX50_18690 [Chitinophagia bacterium]|nr:hypothetical protein [Chitinophagia bacterium]